MNIEIIEFFPIKIDRETGYVSGTIRVKLCDLGIDVLGVYVNRSKGKWFFNLPGRVCIDHKTGKTIRYPYISFDNRETQKRLIATIGEKGKAFVEKRIAENSSIEPQAIKKDEIEPMSSEGIGNLIEAGLKPKNTQKRNWITPTPLKRKPTASYRRK